MFNHELDFLYQDLEFKIETTKGPFDIQGYHRDNIVQET